MIWTKEHEAKVRKLYVKLWSEPYPEDVEDRYRKWIGQVKNNQQLNIAAGQVDGSRAILDKAK